VGWKQTRNLTVGLKGCVKLKAVGVWGEEVRGQEIETLRKQATAGFRGRGEVRGRTFPGRSQKQARDEKSIDKIDKMRKETKNKRGLAE